MTTRWRHKSAAGARGVLGKDDSHPVQAGRPFLRTAPPHRPVFSMNISLERLSVSGTRAADDGGPLGMRWAGARVSRRDSSRLPVEGAPHMGAV